MASRSGTATDGTIYRTFDATARAKSVQNPFDPNKTFRGTNVGLAATGFSNAHQDAYCSDSLLLSGPTSNRIKVQRAERNALGQMAIMMCNSNGVLLATIVSWADGEIKVIAVNPDTLDIVSSFRSQK